MYKIIPDRREDIYSDSAHWPMENTVKNIVIYGDSKVMFLQRAMELAFA